MTIKEEMHFFLGSLMLVMSEMTLKKNKKLKI